jgi:all-trans-retinol dehydrogenase (NAD+)
MSKIESKKALITGGASGIGKLMGLQLLQKGLATLVIWDVNETLLQSTALEFKKMGYDVYIYLVDVMNTTQVINTAALVKKEVGKIDILINNAGIVVGKYFIDHTHEDIDKTMGINSNALMHITREFLGDMMQTKQGHIVNIASAAGMVSNPKLSVYVASKFAVIGWSDSLRLEMEKEKTNVKITTVTPFYISTGMFDGVKSSIIPIVKPQNAVNKIIRGIENDRLYVRMPGIVNWVYFVKGILPARWFDTIVGKWFGMHATMNAVSYTHLRAHET